MARPLHLAWALLLGACFTGGFLSGQPCADDADCGPKLRCEAGVCGGPSGQTTSSTTSGTTAGPTTSSTTVAPTTTTGSPTGTSSTGDATTGDACGIGRCTDLDILFVADNSASMLLKLLVLLDFVQTFGSELLPEVRQACSVHVGVTTTDEYLHNPVECQTLGALVQANKNENACVFVEGKPYATLPDLDQPLSLQCMLDVGADGSDNEQPIDAMFSTVGYLEPGLNAGCNAGFYRPNAFLTVIMVTDEDDDDGDAQGNNGSTSVLEQTWAGTLANLKPTGVADLYLVGLFGNPDVDPDCVWEPLTGDDGVGYEPAPKLRKFIQSVPPDHHALGTMCGVVPNAEAYVPLMQEIRAEIRAACGAE